MSWKQWKTIKLERLTKKGKNINRMSLVEFTRTFKEILVEYLKQLKDMSQHQFNKVWQMKNFNQALENMEIGQILFIHDFSQNILLYIQDEVSGAHWDHKQVTIHPTTCFYATKLSRKS